MSDQSFDDMVGEGAGKRAALLKYRERSSMESFVETASDIGHVAASAFVAATNISEMAYIDMEHDEWGEGSVVLQGNQKRMTPCQEYLNAASMLFPIASCVIYILGHPRACINVWLVSIAQCVHMPVAMLYHIQMGRYQKQMHPINNLFRVSDQVFIMIGSAMWALALSGTIWYGAVVSCLCVLYIYWLIADYYDVSEGHEGDGRKGGAPGRRHSIAMMVVLQQVPVFAVGDWFNGLLALTSFAVSSAIFATYPCGGYSHSVFHVGLGPFTWFCLCAADEVGGIKILHGSCCGIERVLIVQGTLISTVAACVMIRHRLCFCR